MTDHPQNRPGDVQGSSTGAIPERGMRRPQEQWAEDTIGAISTAPGTGAIGIVRLSGPEAIKIAEAVFRFSRKEVPRLDETYTLHYGHVVDPRTGEVVDEALLGVMRKPRSYTREDVVEFHCHGGPAAQRAVLRVVVRQGARLAEPGEFTKRAFLNGRIDLAQAESVAAIVSARSSGALRASVRQLDGGLSERLRAVRRELIGLLARVEVTVDFSDEDVDELDWEALAEGIEQVREILVRLLDTAFVGRALERGVRTAIVGKPNAGKSSLLNALLMRERAIVSETPGTTRDTVEELMEIGGIPIHLVDTAGIRVGGDHVEQLGVERSVKAMEQADLVLAVVDLAAPRDDAERVLVRAADPARLIVVGNKRDLVDDGALDRLLAYLHIPPYTSGRQSDHAERSPRVCAVSALTGGGMDELRTLIQEIVAGKGGLNLEEPILTTERQRILVEEALAGTAQASAGARQSESEELVCEDIRAAVNALGKITGEDLTPDLLDEIFSHFCLGK